MNRVYAENVIEKIVSAERSAAEIMMHAHDIIAESKSGQRRRSMTISMQGICLLSTPSTGR